MLQIIEPLPPFISQHPPHPLSLIYIPRLLLLCVRILSSTNLNISPRISSLQRRHSTININISIFNRLVEVSRALPVIGMEGLLLVTYYPLRSLRFLPLICPSIPLTLSIGRYRSLLMGIQLIDLSSI